MLCSAETADARLTFIGLKYTTIRHGGAAEVSDLNSQYYGNPDSENHVTVSNIFVL